MTRFDAISWSTRKVSPGHYEGRVYGVKHGQASKTLALVRGKTRAQAAGAAKRKMMTLKTKKNPRRKVKGQQIRHQWPLAKRIQWTYQGKPWYVRSEGWVIVEGPDAQTGDYYVTTVVQNRDTKGYGRRIAHATKRLAVHAAEKRAQAHRRGLGIPGREEPKKNPSRKTFKKGEAISVKPAWLEPGEEDLDFFVYRDQNPYSGFVDIVAYRNGKKLLGIQQVGENTITRKKTKRKNPGEARAYRLPRKGDKIRFWELTSHLGTPVRKQREAEVLKREKGYLHIRFRNASGKGFASGVFTTKARKMEIL